MEMSEAQALLKDKRKENWIVVRLDNNFKLVLPFKAGQQLIAALEHAEMFADAWGNLTKIRPLSPDSVQTSLMSHQDWTRCKLATLLDMEPNDIPNDALNF